MSVGHVITGGLGNGTFVGSVAQIVTLGLTQGSPAVVLILKPFSIDYAASSYSIEYAESSHSVDYKNNEYSIEYKEV